MGGWGAQESQRRVRRKESNSTGGLALEEAGIQELL